MRFSYLRLLQLGSVADRVVLTDATPAPAALATGLLLCHAAAEAVIVQDEAEEVIRAIRARESLGLVAPRGGPLVRRFFALRDQLPVTVDRVEEIYALLVAQTQHRV